MKTDLRQQALYNQLLVSIIYDVEHHYGVEFTETSGHRPDSDGVHGTNPCRGVDLSCPDYNFGKLVEKYANSKYQYDPDRPKYGVCLYHKGDSGAYHLHFQVHERTMVINQ